MSDQFQHVMVLTSIIIGLGITNALLGISGAIERYSESDRPLYLGWASAFWLGYVFLWMVDFWWWEFRLVDILKHWTLWDYFLIISYAVLLFLLVAFLVPRNWDKVDDLDAYFMAKRRWFYSANALALVFDLMDSYMKGGMTYMKAQGFLSWGLDVAGILVTIVGFRAVSVRTHTVLAIGFFVWQVAVGFDAFPFLHG